MREIPVGKQYFALVDDDDYERLIQFSWSPKKNKNRKVVYAYRALRNVPPGESQYMHKTITGFARTDHINGDGLDNRKENLRAASNAENHRNISKVRTMNGNPTTSSFKGVTWNRKDKRWAAKIHINGKAKFLGNFKEEEQAALAYNQAAIELFGAFAFLNELGGDSH